MSGKLLEGVLLFISVFLLKEHSAHITKNRATHEETILDFKTLMDVLHKPRPLERYHTFSAENLVVPFFQQKVYELNTGVKVKSLSWDNCGKTSDPVQIQKLTISPDPIKLPGNITFSAQATAKVPITKPVKIDLEIQKKVLFWIPIPCIDNVGSCSYPDACAMLQQLWPTSCPPPFVKNHIPCHCPAKAGSYSVPNTSMYVNPKGIPGWLTEGDYQVRATLSHNGSELTCLHLYLSLSG